MYVADLELIQAEVLCDVGGKGRVELCKLLSLLKWTEELQTRADEASGEFERAFEAVFGAKRVLDTLVGAEPLDEGLDAMSVCRIFYLASLYEALHNGWEQAYKVIVESDHLPHVTTAIKDLYESLDRTVFAGELDRVGRLWTPHADMLLDTAVCLLCWRCALAGIFASPRLYMHVASCLKVKGPFVVVYAAAGCLKADGVLERLHEVANLTDEQYGCVRMLDCFFYVPGGKWG